MKVREDALTRLRQSVVDIDDEFCLIAGIKVKNVERVNLINQIESDSSYLKVPLSLLLSSPFWRALKADSNQRESVELDR